jgi:hypothetical protein
MNLQKKKVIECKLQGIFGLFGPHQKKVWSELELLTNPWSMSSLKPGDGKTSPMSDGCSLRHIHFSWFYVL